MKKAKSKNSGQHLFCSEPFQRLSTQAHCVLQACHISHSRPLTPRQAEEGVDVSDLPALMDSDDDEMLINDPVPLSPTPSLWPLRLTPHHHHHHLSASQCPGCLPNSGKWNHAVPTLFLFYIGCVFIISFLLLLYVGVFLGFVCYLVWFHRLLLGSGSAQKFSI